MTTDEISGKPRVPVGELEELVEEWDRIASEKALHHKETFNARCDTYHKAAKELEALIERYDYE